MTELKMVYSLMEDMAATFYQSAQTLENVCTEVNNLANQMEGGSLLGKGGDFFVAAVRSNLTKQINLLRDKMNELNGDIIGAMGDMAMEDGRAEQKFE